MFKVLSFHYHTVCIMHFVYAKRESIRSDFLVFIITPVPTFFWIASVADVHMLQLEHIDVSFICHPIVQIYEIPTAQTDGPPRNAPDLLRNGAQQVPLHLVSQHRIFIHTASRNLMHYLDTSGHPKTNSRQFCCSHSTIKCRSKSA